MTATPQQLAAKAREAHAKAMEALAADAHPYSGAAVRDWEKELDAALDELESLAEQYDKDRRTAMGAAERFRDQGMKDAARAEQLQQERDEAVRGNWKSEPSGDGGEGKEETYWLRNKLRSCVVHLRDVEDYYRLRGGTPDSFNMVRADRARSLYEQISEDFINGRKNTPTMRQRAESAEARAEQLQRDVLEYQHAYTDANELRESAERERDNARREYGHVLGQLTRRYGDLHRAEAALRAEREKREQMEKALLDLLDNIGGHNHWDSTMRYGAGCETCIRQSAAKERARLVLASAGEANREETPRPLNDGTGYFASSAGEEPSS